MMQEFTQQVEEMARAVTDEIHTALPGEIISFDASTGLATAKPIGKYTNSTGEQLEYPTVTDAPVVFPFCQSAGVGMAFPIYKKDSCLILISEVELDEWRTGASSEGSLKFDLSSAVVLPGLLQGGGDIVAKACKKNAVVVAAGGTELMVSDAGVNIDGDLIVTGDIKTPTGTVKAGSIDLKKHVHTSSTPGSDTSVPR